MKKKIFAFAIPVSLIFSAGVASAQSHYYDPALGEYVESSPSTSGSSTQDLKQELARERYLTQIAIERQKRQRLEREDEARSYDNRMREAQYRRAEQERDNRQRNEGINSINAGVNVLGNIARVAGMVSSNW